MLREQPLIEGILIKSVLRRVGISSLCMWRKQPGQRVCILVKPVVRRVHMGNFKPSCMCMQMAAPDRGSQR